jgi:hypothetical protein
MAYNYRICAKRKNSLTIRLMRTYPANFLNIIALGDGAKLRLLLEIEAASTLYYSDQSFSVGAQAYLPQVLSFGRIQNNRIKIELSNVPRVDNLIKAGQDVNIYLWDTSLDAADKGIIFSGVVADGIGGNKYKLNFTCSPVSDKFDKMVGTLFTAIAHPSADPDIYNTMSPIIIGPQRNVKCAPIEAGMLTTLRTDISADYTTDMDITEHSRGGLTFTTSGGAASTRTVIIGDEEIIYTTCEKDDTPRFVTLTRGANGTTAVSHTAGDAVIEKVAELVYKIADHDLKAVTKPRIIPFGSSDNETVQIDAGDYSLNGDKNEITLTNIVGIRRQVQLAVTQQPTHTSEPQPTFDVTPGTHDHPDTEQTVDFFMDEVKSANMTTSSNEVRAVDGKFIGSASFDPSNNDWYIRTSKIGTVGLSGTLGNATAKWRIWRSVAASFEVTLNWLIDGDTIYSNTVNIDENETTFTSGSQDISSYVPADFNEIDSYLEVTDNTIPAGLIYVTEMWITLNITPPSPDKALTTDIDTQVVYTQQDAVIGGDSVADTLGGDLIVNVEGKPDDGSGTYTGTPNALIEKPPHVFHWLLKTWGNGVTDSDIDLAGSFQDCEDNLPASYKFSIYLRKRIKLNNLLRSLAIQAFCRFEWSLIGKAELIRRRTSGSVVRSLDTDNAILPGDINQKNKEEAITFNKPALVDIANDVEVLYYQNPVLGDESDSDIYEGQSQDDDATSISDYGLRKKTWLMPAIGDNDTMADDVRAKLLAYYKDGHQANGFPFDMSQLELEPGDLIGLTCDDLEISASQHDIIQIDYDLPSLLKKQDLICWINALNLNVAV